jgi:hypothetical protein
MQQKKTSDEAKKNPIRQLCLRAYLQKKIFNIEEKEKQNYSTSTQPSSLSNPQKLIELP